MHMASTSDLKSGNIQAVRRCFYMNESLSVNEAKKLTGLSHGCTVNAFRVLEDSGEIGLSEKTGKTVGRKTHRYALNEEFRHFAVIDVSREHNGFSSRSWRMNLKGDETDVRTRTFAAMDETYFHEEISSLMRAYPDTDMILISTPGICEEGVITNGETFRMDIGGWIEAEYHIPYVIENDVNVAAIGFYAVLGVLIQTRFALQGIGSKLIPMISSVIELVGKILFVYIFIPKFGYDAVCWCEPLIWFAMTAQLLYAFNTNSYIRETRAAMKQAAA